jgi:hypothetical protein
MCSVLTSFFGLSTCSQWTRSANNMYLTEIIQPGSSGCYGKEIATHSICSLLRGYYICYLNSKRVHFVLLLWVRFPYRELPFWVVKQRVVVITTTRCVITQKIAVLICFMVETWNHAGFHTL